MPGSQLQFLAGAVLLLFLVQAGDLEGLKSESYLAADGWIRVSPGGETGCGLGGKYSFFHRDGSDFNSLLIYFQGGGACWNWVSCSGMFDTRVKEDELSGFAGIFDQSNPDNPFRAFQTVFIPYCTGDVHIGDTLKRYGDDPSARPIAHYGYRNVSAVFQWMAEQAMRPEVVVVAGTSAGSYGALFYMQEVQRMFPHSRIILLGDSGVPLLNDNSQIIRDWGAEEVLGKLWHGVTSQEAPLREAYRQAARGGRRTHLAQITSNHDAVQGAFYLISGSPRWREATYDLFRDVAEIDSSFRSFIVDGSDHGLLPTDAFYRFKSNGIYLKDWVGRLVRGEPVEDVRCKTCAMD